jgi:hypothetical protein
MHRRAQGLEAGERSSELDDTALGQLLTDPDHPVQATKYWVAGDDAYKGNASHSQSLLTPWPPQPEGIGTWKDAFNAFQSSCRVEVEGAFGALVKRWAVLQKNLNVSLPHATLMLEALVLLHNECMTANIPAACGRGRSDGCGGVGQSRRADYRGPRAEWPDWNVADACMDGAMRERHTAAGSSNQPLCNVLTATLEHLGKERPPRQRYRGYLAGSAAQL